MRGSVQIKRLRRARGMTQWDLGNAAYLAVGLRLKAGTVEMTDVLKDNKSVNADMKILHSDGKEVASESKPLSHFGFS